MRALASPASFKGVLRPVEAARVLAAGLRRGGVADAVEVPLADGGEGTAEVIAAVRGGRWEIANIGLPFGDERMITSFVVLEDGTAVVEAADAIGLSLLSPSERDPLRLSTRGLGELLVSALEATDGEVLVCLGDTATVDGGAGLLEVVGERARGRRLRALCDVSNPLLGERGAARAFGPQKGATPEVVEELERRLAAMTELAPYAELPGAGAAGGVGAALASLGAELVSGAAFTFELLDLPRRIAAADLVVTGEGAVDRSTFEGKVVGEVVRLCGEVGVRCVIVAGRVDVEPAGIEVRVLPGDHRSAPEELEELGRRLVAELGVA